MGGSERSGPPTFVETRSFCALARQRNVQSVKSIFWRPSSVTFTRGSATLPEGVTLADFSTELDKGGDVLSIPFTDLDGDDDYTVDFLYLAPGLYPVVIAAPEGLTITTDSELSFDVSVLSGTVEKVTIVITSVVEV